MSVEIRGVNEVVHNISRFKAEVVQRLVDVAQISQAKVVNYARSLVPVRTGNLRNSIQPGAVEVSDNGVNANIEARMSYASYVEYGTGPYTTFPGGSTSARPWGMRAQPYLIPALYMVLPEFQSRIKAALREARSK